VENRETLAEALRERLMLTGTKVSCNHGECGACTVIADGDTAYACSMLAVQANGKSITTIEGIGGGQLHPVQQAFIDNDALQCGYCTPGQVIAAKDLLDKNPSPTKDEVLLGLSGNMCRCGSYRNIVNAVLDAAKRIG
ncbi:MAG: 2Fe-2S iron-sulfur cluster binding domain-containing protein, partial [Gemmatimonadales bacterium]|nr:2Fe-2S iron-sulfur cluster binding domain-containing protein [Gemmatimonadales bacterium]